MDTPFSDEPTEPRDVFYRPGAGEPTVPMQPPPQTQPATSTPVPVSANAPQKPARRRFMGKSLAGLAALGGIGIAAAAGGVALEQWIAHGGPGAGSGPIANEVQIGHLLRRAGFGATADDLALYRTLGYTGAVDRLLNYQQVPDDAMENRLKELNLNLNSPTDQQRWWLLRMAWTQRPLLEKMTLFWHGVLTSSFRKVGGKQNIMRMMIQNQFLRTHAFDTFDNILLGITTDPAMLFYLDLTKSRKNAPNENYARELMELFTLGLGHYTQQDVYEGASALTGWHVTGGSTTAVYRPADHNTLTKRYLGQSGNFDYRDVIRILANHPATPWFICRKLF